ncbi:hypothetical protein BH09BAC3_BH09BAC3_26560 [soil metagenome]
MIELSETEYYLAKSKNVFAYKCKRRRAFKPRAFTLSGMLLEFSRPCCQLSLDVIGESIVL